MEKVTSADGTTIAYDRLGAGEPVILIGGALCDRRMLTPLATELARSLDVSVYDRRGRGDSGGRRGLPQAMISIDTLSG